MSLSFKIALPSEIDEILEFENKKLREVYTDDNERMLEAWKSRARKEALEHYLPMGWSFLARDPNSSSPFSQEGLLVGYFIAQPLLFLEGQTQSLWVEHLQYSSLQARDELCELAYKLSREKHFQRVYFPPTQGIANSVKAFKPEDWNNPAIVIRTTKG